MIALLVSLALVSPASASAPVAAPVPHERFKIAVEGWRAARREVRSLRRTLRHQPSVAEALTVASVAYGVPRAELSAVSMCESTHRAHARNPSGASGLFQFMPGTWAGNRFGAAGLSVWSPYASAMGAAYHVSRYGWGAWECKP